MDRVAAGLMTTKPDVFTWLPFYADWSNAGTSASFYALGERQVSV
jgi:hypothetical protein